MNNILRLMAAGPVVCLLDISLIIAGATILALVGKIEPTLSMIESAEKELKERTVFSFLRGLSSIALTLLLSFGVFARIGPLRPLAILLLFASAVVFALGSAVSSIVVGKTLRNSFQLNAESRASFQTGFLSLSTASIFPIVGWITSCAIALAGTGALLFCMMKHRSNAV